MINSRNYASFVDDPQTRTDDWGYLLSVSTQAFMPYFLVIVGICVGIYAASSNRVQENDSRSGLLNMASGITGAALIAIDPRKTQRRNTKEQSLDGD